MLAVELKKWLEDILKKADDLETIEIDCNGAEIEAVEYIKNIDSNGIAQESISIKF